MKTATDRSPHYTSREVARAARRVHMSLADMHLDLARRLEMTPVELLALAHLGMEGHLSPGDLAHRLHMRSGAVTAVLDRLTQHGYIIREPHPSDRRQLVVFLTDAGKEATMHELRPMVAEVIALVDELEPGEREVVGRFLDDLAALIAIRTPDGKAGKAGAKRPA